MAGKVLKAARSAIQMQPRSATPSLDDLSVAGTKETLPRDRRKRTRLQVQWPILFTGGPGAAMQAVTQDLSSDGFYYVADTSFVPGEVRSCTLFVPAYDPADPARTIPVRCRIRVVRVEVLAETGRYGVGCRIDDYRVLS